jgi:ribosomal protein S18 acetylase RimI-like enzyme
MQGRPIIRPYHPTDKIPLLTIFRSNVPEFFDAMEVEVYETYLEKNADSYLVIELNKKIAGGVGYLVSPSAGQITWIFFDPALRGMGLGKKAVEYCLDIFTSNPDIRKIVVTTSQLAFRFFEKMGFQLVRIEKDHWGKGLDLYEMVMPQIKRD